jgi:hypothetical protein
MSIALLVLGSLLALAPPSNSRLDAFLVELQRVSARDDRRALAVMVEYPLTVFASGWNIPVKDRATFLQSYDAFFTAVAGRVLEAATGTPVWVGRVPVEGDYRIEVVRTIATGNPIQLLTNATSLLAAPGRDTDWRSARW